jgi:hypothetical protein
VLRSAIFMLRKFGWSSVRLIITAKWWGGGLTGAYGRKVGWPGRVGVLACGTITEVKHPILHLWLSFLGGRVRLLTL